jgi:hypothetical protein
VVTWGQYYDQCFSFAKALISLDFQAHHAINIIGFNSVRHDTQTRPISLSTREPLSLSTYKGLQWIEGLV